VVVDAKGRPVVGARVSAWAKDRLRLPFEVERSDPLTLVPTADAETVSGADGEFSLVARDVGYYVLRIDAPGLARRVIPVSCTVGVVPRLRIALAAGVRRTGQVVGALGKPVAGAKVTLIAANMEGDPWQTLVSRHEATTDAEGRWTIEGVPPPLDDALPFGVPLPDFVSIQTAGQRDRRWAARADPSQGGTPRRDVVAPGTSSVAVRLRAPDGEPIRGRVLLTLSETDALLARYLEATAETHEDGRIVIEGLPNWTLAGAIAAGAGHFGQLQREQVVDLVPATRLDLDLALEPAKVVTGTVRANGRPVQGARVWLEGFDPLTERTHGVTDLTGRFDLRAVPHMPTRLRVSASGFATVDAEVPQDGGAPLVVDVVPPGRISGRVLLADGKPAPGAWVTSSLFLARGGAAHETVLAGDDGEFSLPILTPGWGSVGAWVPPRRRGDAEVDVGPGEHEAGVEIRMPPD
jgi:hypothetical protein